MLSTVKKHFTPKTCSVIMLAIIVFSLFTGCEISFSASDGFSIDEDSLKSQGRIATQVTVTDVKSKTTHRTGKRRSNSTSRQYYVSYTANGKSYTSKLSGDLTGISEGDTFIAYYSPTDPSSIIRPIQSSTIYIGITIGAVFILIFITLILIKRKKKNRY